MGSLRRLLEWLRDLDARYGYVKRSRVMPGDPAPVRLRKVADTGAVVLVQPSVPAPEPVATPTADDVDAELADLRTDRPADPPRDWAEPEGADDEADQADGGESDPPTAVLAPVADTEAPITPLVPNPDAINRLRGHRPDRA